MKYVQPHLHHILCHYWWKWGNPCGLASHTSLLHWWRSSQGGCWSVCLTNMQFGPRYAMGSCNSQHSQGWAWLIWENIFLALLKLCLLPRNTKWVTTKVLQQCVTQSIHNILNGRNEVSCLLLNPQYLWTNLHFYPHAHPHLSLALTLLPPWHQWLPRVHTFINF